MTLTATTSLDPLAPGHPGRWSHGPVTVCHRDRAGVQVKLLSERAPDAVTEHFRVHRNGGSLTVLHQLRPDELDDDLVGFLCDELGGLLGGADDFRRVLAGVVRSTISDPVTAWAVYYANTLAALAAPPGTERRSGSIATFAPVHHRAVERVAGASVLDLGSCFGFLAMRLADLGHRVIASDLCPGTVGLLNAVADRLGRRLSSIVCDAVAIPLADRSVDTVTSIHLLEHLCQAQGAAMIAEAVRVARRRVVVAVPFEEEPEPLYGHLRSLDVGALQDLGARTGLPYRVEVHHGGWLVIDRG